MWVPWWKYVGFRDGYWDLLKCAVLPWALGIDVGVGEPDVP